MELKTMFKPLTKKKTPQEVCFFNFFLIHS